MAKPKEGDGEFDIYEDNTSHNTQSTAQQSPSRSPSEGTVIHNEDLRSDNGKDEHTEALIQEAARNIIEQIEQDAYNRRAGAAPHSEISYSGTENTFTDESELTFGEGTEISYDDRTEINYGSASQYQPSVQNDDDASSSSHHEDDVFSHGRRSSGGSINSSNAARSPTKRSRAQTPNAFFPASHEGDISGDKSKQPQISIQECESNTPIVSRIPSCATNVTYSMLHDNTTPTNSNLGRSTHTPSNSLPLSAFRSPGSVRNLQMSSPAPSIFAGNSPQSRKRPLTPRSGTPTNKLGSSPLKKSTPIFVKKETPLVLLHITVLPLQWPYADVIENAPNHVLSQELLNVKESWKLLKEKLGDMVLERGVLIAHPQDSYEILEERLFAALELPNRPRAKILDCGHYLGPTSLTDEDDDTDMSSCETSDDEDNESVHSVSKRSTWCDVCCRDVKYGKSLAGPKKKIFKMKVFASNGLMGSGAWVACWRQMEKVDVEIEVVTEPGFGMEISELFDMAVSPPSRAAEDAYEEEDTLQPRSNVVSPDPFTESAFVKFAKPEELPSMSTQLVTPPRPEPEAITAVAEPILSTPEKTTRELEEEILRIERDQARLREIYGDHGKSEATSPPQHHQQSPHHESQSRNRAYSTQSDTRSHRSRHQQPKRREVDNDSFLDLLLAAARVLLQDKKNIVIGFLGVVVLVLAMRVGHVQITGGGGGLEGSLQRQQLAMQSMHSMPDVHIQAPQVRVQPQVPAPAPPMVEQVRYEAMAPPPPPPAQAQRAVEQVQEMVVEKQKVQMPHPVVEPFLAEETIVRQVVVPPRADRERMKMQQQQQQQEAVGQAPVVSQLEAKVVEAVPVKEEVVAKPVEAVPKVAEQVAEPAIEEPVVEVITAAEPDEEEKVPIDTPVQPAEIVQQEEPAVAAEPIEATVDDIPADNSAPTTPEVAEVKPATDNAEKVKVPTFKTAKGRPDVPKPEVVVEKAEKIEKVEAEVPVLKTANGRPRVEPFQS